MVLEQQGGESKTNASRTSKKLPSILKAGEKKIKLSRCRPAHRAEAHGAEVCAKFLYTQPETFPAPSDSPAQQ